MPHRETVKTMLGTKTGAWITGGILLCSLAAAQVSRAAQQLPAQPNVARQQLNQEARANAPAAQGQQPPQGQPRTTAAAPRPVAARRDPFAPLVDGPGRGSALPERLPPGKAGLVITTLRVDGIVRGPNGMIAIVSNPQGRVYFLREGDRLYDGTVLRITMTNVSLRQSGRDPFGRPVERDVNKPLMDTTPGEAQ